MDNKDILLKLEELLEEMHQQQRAKAKTYAHRIRPDLSEEDLLNPDNFPEIMSDPSYVYEDGIAAGILSAKMAVKSFLINTFSLKIC